MDFAQLEKEYNPKKNDGQYEPPLAKLPDGEWEMLVKDGFLYETKTGRPAYKFIMVNQAPGTEFDGWEIHKITVIDSPTAMSILGGQLMALGIDSDMWGERHGRPLKDELQKLIQTMRGWVILCRKAQSTGKNGQHYHNLYFHAKVGTVKPKDSEDADLPF